jgi:hypothetical protein
VVCLAFARRVSDLVGNNNGTRERHPATEVSLFKCLFKRNKNNELFQPHCEICQKKDRGEEMLLCDGCDCGMIMINSHRTLFAHCSVLYRFPHVLPGPSIGNYSQGSMVLSHMPLWDRKRLWI